MTAREGRRTMPYCCVILTSSMNPETGVTTQICLWVPQSTWQGNGTIPFLLLNFDYSNHMHEFTCMSKKRNNTFCGVVLEYLSTTYTTKTFPTSFSLSCIWTYACEQINPVWDWSNLTKVSLKGSFYNDVTLESGSNYARLTLLIVIVQLLHVNLPDWNVKHGRAHKERYEYAWN